MEIKEVYIKMDLILAMPLHHDRINPRHPQLPIHPWQQNKRPWLGDTKALISNREGGVGGPAMRTLFGSSQTTIPRPHARQYIFTFPYGLAPMITSNSLLCPISFVVTKPMKQGRILCYQSSSCSLKNKDSEMSISSK